VQVYVRDVVASVTPPGRRLKRFAKVYLEPGQSRQLTFRLGMNDLSFIGADNKPVVEAGDFEVMVAGLKDKFTLTAK
jgi:beta-glucosidase